MTSEKILIFIRWDLMHWNIPIAYTKNCHKSFVRLLVMIQEVFKVESIKYNIKLDYKMKLNT